MKDLKPCPCGKTPKKLIISDAGQGGKWAYVGGDCCEDWEIEFRTDYYALDDPKCERLAIQCWNEAERGFVALSKIEELIKKHSLISDGYGGVLETVEIKDLQTLIDDTKQ